MIRTAFATLSALALVLPAPGPLAGQASEEGVAAAVAPAVKVGSVDGSAAILLGGKVSLQVTPSFAVGGSGFRLARDLTLGPEGRPDSPRLGFGYGGVLLGYRRPFPDAAEMEWSLGASLLLGAGNARLRSAAGDVELGTENVLVAEPVGVLSVAFRPWLEASVQGGYRWAGPVDSLPGISPGGLRGASITFAVRFVRNP